MKTENIVLRTGLNKFFDSYHQDLKDTVCFFDTSISSLNVGDEIINSSGLEQLNRVFSKKQFFNVSTHDGVSSIGIHNANLCEERIVCGSNLMCDTMFRSANWNLSVFDVVRLKKCLLMGVGWNRYGYDTSLVTKYFYNKLLYTDGKYHSVRDDFTKRKMEGMGFHNVINTGCPTMWKFTSEHCYKVETNKSDSVVFTLTDYDKDVVNDKLMIDILCSMYEKVYFWPQGSGDRKYLSDLSVSGVEVISPQLKAYDNILDKESIDFVGTRLHGGIRALQKFRRTIIVAIDNRAIEKAKDFNLPVVNREDIRSVLKSKIDSNIVCDINIREDAINKWLEQFI